MTLNYTERAPSYGAAQYWLRAAPTSSLGGLLGFGERLVPIPIESVALTGPQVTVVDMPPHRFQKTPTWYGSNSEALAAAETISVSRR